MPASSRHSVCYSQNFLKEPDLVAWLLDQSSLEREDVVYEIGPGKGLITRQLALRYWRVVAIEKDSRLTAWLQREFAGWPNVTIHQGDFLDYRLPCQPYKVFGGHVSLHAERSGADVSGRSPRVPAHAPAKALV
jgi:16S rRNA A1518/A1519 N6-dimethyltransferase RsmA/KsgA/DIM1 with predicted DNA glycosylase/AP lyase activity